MPKPIERLSRSRNTVHRDRHRYEHWLVDNQVYFLTARCRDRFPAFASEAAKCVFWNRFDHYTAGLHPSWTIITTHLDTSVWVRICLE